MCGICLVVGTSKAAETCRDVLAKLQHRGQQGAKIYSEKDGKVVSFGGKGLVMEELMPADLEQAKGKCLTIPELLKQNPKGKDVRIIG